MIYGLLGSVSHFENYRGGGGGGGRGGRPAPPPSLNILQKCGYEIEKAARRGLAV